MSQNAAFDDASIPVLTEVVDDTPQAAPAAEATEVRAPDNTSEQEWELLEHRVTQRILRQLQEHVDLVLEQRLRDSIASALQQALAGLGDDIREGLQPTLENVVANAVAQELAHLQTLKR